MQRKDDIPREHLLNHAWVAYISPFSFVIPDEEEPMAVSLEEINTSTYNYGELCRIIEIFPIPLESVEGKFTMLVCYDGALAIPRYGKFALKEDAIEFLSSVLCHLLIGGIYCEAIDARDVVWGQLYEKQLLWPVDIGQSVSSQLHGSLRTKAAGPLQTITLSAPRIIRLSEFREAHHLGEQVTQAIPNLSPKFLIRGVTELKYRNWSSALSNLWICIEQLTDFLWRDKFLGDKSRHPKQAIPGRRKSLREDHRTWPSSVKQEILFQDGFIDEGTFAQIFPARQARNRLVHDGKTVEEDAAFSAYRGLLGMLSHCVSDIHVPLGELGLFDRKNESVELALDESYFQDWLLLSGE